MCIFWEKCSLLPYFDLAGHCPGCNKLQQPCQKSKSIDGWMFVRIKECRESVCAHNDLRGHITQNPSCTPKTKQRATFKKSNEKREKKKNRQCKEKLLYGKKSNSCLSFRFGWSVGRLFSQLAYMHKSMCFCKRDEEFSASSVHQCAREKKVDKRKEI